MLERLGRCLLVASLAGSALLLAPARGAAQGLPYTLDQIATLLAGGVEDAQILELVRQDCIAFRVEGDAVTRLRQAGASDSLLTALRAVCYRGAEREPPPVTSPAAVARYSPGSAAVRSALVPGLGQFYTGRPLLGVALLGASGGALAAGLLSEKVTIECLARTTDGTCPPGQARDEVSERPYLAAGIGAFAALAVIGAIEAYAGANRANQRAGSMRGDAARPGSGIRLAAPALAAGGRQGATLEIVRLRF